MKIFILALASFFLFVRCSTNKEKFLEKEELINMIVGDELDGYVYYASYYLFNTPNKKNELGWTNSIDLENAYNNQTIYSDYKYFVINVLSSNGTVNYELFDNCFILNDSVMYAYTKYNFDTFLNLYTRKNSIENSFRIHRDLSENVQLTIMYYCYINDYFSYYDDISGYYYTERIPLGSLVKTLDEPYFEQLK